MYLDFISLLKRGDMRQTDGREKESALTDISCLNSRKPIANIL
ncbi:hypothetical protein BAT_0943 [Bacillus pumilus ATCC 7061]|nr:hypothetical protein BAT_0943 [Bacillus pumilus ATCC 7061]